MSPQLPYGAFTLLPGGVPAVECCSRIGKCAEEADRVDEVVDRVVRLGFEVRVDATVDGQPIWAQVTRYRAQLLDLKPGDTVYVRILERVDVPVA